MSQSPTDDAATASPRLDRWVEATTRPLDVLALVFLVVLVAQWLLAITTWAHGAQMVGNAVSLLVWAAFAVDYVARLTLSTDRGDFVRHHKLDLLMVLVPFLRIVRVLLILRKSLSRLSTDKIAESMLLIVASLVALGALVEWRLESNAGGASITSISRAFWWAIVTTTTVGYGDEYPVTEWGRVVAVLVMLVGIGLIGTVSATVASWFVARQRAAQDAAEEAEDDERDAVVTALSQRLEQIATEQTRIRELLEELAGRDA